MKPMGLLAIKSVGTIITLQEVRHRQTGTDETLHHARWFAAKHDDTGAGRSGRVPGLAEEELITDREASWTGAALCRFFHHTSHASALVKSFTNSVP
jgi:hypothetical protein